MSESTNEFYARLERERIADWLAERAKLVMNSDPSGAFELTRAAARIRSNDLDPRWGTVDSSFLGKSFEERDGGHGDDR